VSGDCGHGWAYHEGGPGSPCTKCEDERLRSPGKKLKADLAAAQQEIERLKALLTTTCSAGALSSDVAAEYVRKNIEARAEIERLKAGLREARDALDTAWRQAGDYFYDKYAEADLETIDALLKEPKP